MDIVLIGSGNVATVLGRKSLAAGHRIVQVYSPNDRHANILATRLGTSSTSYISSIEKKADLMIIALRDVDAVRFVKDLGKINFIAAHTAGALSINEIQSVSGTFGVIYPLQSLCKEIEIIPPLSILVDGNDQHTKDQLKKFASTLSATVIEANDENRLKYHLAATIVNNFTNHLFVLVESFCEKENISFAVLQPLLEETVMRLRYTSPAEVQTGPALRNDQITIEKHKTMLKTYPALKEFYELFTLEIQKSVLGIKL